MSWSPHAQRCEPQPLASAPRSYWVSDMESLLFSQWNESNLRPLDPLEPLPQSPLNQSSMSNSYRSSSSLNVLYAKNNANSNLHLNGGSPAPKSLRIENGFDDPKSSSSNATTNPHDHCQREEFPLCRSTGVPYRLEPGCGPLTVPYGVRYHVRLQEAWSSEPVGHSHSSSNSRSEPKLAGRGAKGHHRSVSSSSTDELDDSLVLDIINLPDSSAFPQPIPLPQMLALLRPMWEEEGLVDLARSREAAYKSKP